MSSRAVSAFIAVMCCLVGQPQKADAQVTKILTYADGIAMLATFDARKDHRGPCRAEISEHQAGIEISLSCGRLFGNRARFELFKNSSLRPGWTIAEPPVFQSDADNSRTFMTVNTLPAVGSTNPFASFNLTAAPRTFVKVIVQIKVTNARARPRDNPFVQCLVGGDRVTRGARVVTRFRCSTNSDCSGPKFVCASDPCGQGSFCVPPLR